MGNNWNAIKQITTIKGKQTAYHCTVKQRRVENQYFTKDGFPYEIKTKIRYPTICYYLL